MLFSSVAEHSTKIGLKVEYEINDAVLDSVRCLAALAHVPVGDVADALDHLAESMPATEHMDELVSYFEHTYIHGCHLRGRSDNYRPSLFSHDTWNQREATADGLARTTNIVEGWHYGL